MMKTLKLILQIIIFLCLLMQIDSVAQMRETKNGISLWAKVNKFYSQNHKFYIKTINQSYSIGSHYFGQTFICDTETDSVLYKMDIHLIDDCCYDQHFLSDDGTIFSFITHNCSSDLKICNKILIFKKGILKSTISLDSLLGMSDAKGENIFFNKAELRKDRNHTRNISDCFGEKNINSNFRRDYIYNENEDSLLVFADKYPTFYYKDTLYLISGDLQLYYIDVKNKKNGKFNLKNKYSYLKSKVKSIYTESIDYEGIADYDELPDQIKLIDTISNLLNLRFELKPKDEYFYKELPIQGFLNRDSIFHLFYKNKKLLRQIDSSIIKLISNLKFNTELIPEYSERWYFNLTLFFRNNNDSISRWELLNYERNKEKILEEEAYKDALKDTLNGVYIPKDLYEAMDILDETVSDNMKSKCISYVFKDDLESYQNRPRLNLNSWPLKGNSRISHYLDSIGITHFETQYSVLNSAFRAYLKDETFSLTHWTYKDFLKDSNLFIHFQINFSEVKKPYFTGLRIVKKDSSEKQTLYYPFDKTGFYEYKYFSGDSIFNNYQTESYDYDTQDFLELLSDYFVEYPYIFLHKSCPWDSLLFISDYPNNEYLLSSFRWYLQKDKSDKFMRTQKYNVYYNVGRSELDSLDNIIFNYIQSANKESYYKYSEQSDKFVKSLMEDFLSKKSYADFYVVRFYPYIKFDFKEYKKKKKSQK